MKKITIVLMCLFMASLGFAQKRSKGVIYLKNGSVVKGTMIPIENDKLVVQSNKNTWVFNQSDIDTIAVRKIQKSIDRVEKPWFLELSTGLLAGGSGNPKSAPFSLMGSFKHQLLDQFYVGAGVGIEFWEESYLPAFAQADYYFRKTDFTPFVGLQFGYMLALDDSPNTNTYYDYASYSSYWPGPSRGAYDPEGGLMINPSIGFKGMFHENLGWMFSLGYRYQQLNFDGVDESSMKRNYNRLSIRIGIIFN